MYKKTCKYCDKVHYAKNIETMSKYFYKKNGCIDGLRPICKICFSNFYKSNKTKEQNNQYMKTYRNFQNHVNEIDYCRICTKAFKPKNIFQKTCSKECSNINKKLLNRIRYKKIKNISTNT